MMTLCVRQDTITYACDCQITLQGCFRTASDSIAGQRFSAWCWQHVTAQQSYADLHEQLMHWTASRRRAKVGKNISRRSGRTRTEMCSHTEGVIARHRHLAHVTSGRASGAQQEARTRF